MTKWNTSLSQRLTRSSRGRYCATIRKAGYGNLNRGKALLLGNSDMGGVPLLGNSVVGGVPILGNSVMGGVPLLGNSVVGGVPILGNSVVGGVPLFGNSDMGGVSHKHEGSSAGSISFCFFFSLAMISHSKNMKNGME